MNVEKRSLGQRFNGVLNRASRVFLRGAPWLYHLWYYNNYIWTRTSWMGVPTQKSPSDMWNYQEILFELKPSIVIEFGSCRGGSALFFASVLRHIGRPFTVISVDIDNSQLCERATSDPAIQFVTMSSIDGRIKNLLMEERAKYPGAAFAILDSDHSKNHVLAEMMSLRGVLVAGDYLVVEDSNINGHPVRLPSGPVEGPYEAMEEYFSLFPKDFVHDSEREKKFGFSFATNGFLKRN